MSSDNVDVSTRLYQAWAWLEENKKGLVFGGAAIAVLASGLAVYAWSARASEVQASEALLKVRPAPDAARTSQPPPASAFLEVAAEYSGTAAEPRALLLAGGTLFTEGKYSQAQEQFQTFLRSYGDHPLALTASFGIAASLESEGKLEEALRAYQDVIASKPSPAVLDDARLALARIYEAKAQFPLALQTYDEIAGTNVMSSLATEARTRRSRLLEKNPELVKTNAPAAAATNAIAAPSTNALPSGGDATTNAPAPQ